MQEFSKSAKINLLLNTFRKTISSTKFSFCFLPLGWSFYFIASQKSQTTLRMFKPWLNENHIKQTPEIQKCDFILVACLVVSRIGTDIEAVLKLIPDGNSLGIFNFYVMLLLNRYHLLWREQKSVL